MTGCSGAATTDAPLTLTPCGQFKCGKYEVFENRDARTGRKLQLNIVVAPALSEKPAADPVFFIAGGPGQPSTDLARIEARWQQLRVDRDLVYVDQRGTGGSHRLQCKLHESDDIQSFFRELFPLDAVRACRAELEKIADLTMYTTPIAMDDLDEVRAAMGYERINLIGFSYGTWASLEYLRTHSDRVRSLALAGTATPRTQFPLHFAGGAQTAMWKLIDDCAHDESCRRAFPDLSSEFNSLLERLRKKPAEFRLDEGAIRLSYDAFAERLRLMLYDTASASRVPLSIHHAAQGNWIPFATAALARTRSAAENLAMGMYFSVTCSEAVPTITDADIERETAGTFVGSFRTRVHQRACGEWPRASVPVDYYRPVESDVPVLMLAGELDPATPPEFAEEAAKSLRNGRVVRIKNVAHGYTSECAVTTMTEFIVRGSAAGLETGCFDGMKRPAFVPPRE